MLATLRRAHARGVGSGLFWIAGLALVALAAQAGRAHASGPETAPVTTSAGLQKLVNKMRKELAVTHDVTVELVGHNPLKASVEPIRGVARKGATRRGASRKGANRKGDTRSFRLSIERAFLAKLTAEELRAVIAHELGHVWIYTHHPYLQTEQLANTIAVRVVSRESIVKVYGKVWADAGAAGSLPRFSDEPVAAGLGSARPQK